MDSGFAFKVIAQDLKLPKESIWFRPINSFSKETLDELTSNPLDNVVEMGHYRWCELHLSECEDSEVDFWTHKACTSLLEEIRNPNSICDKSACCKKLSYITDSKYRLSSPAEKKKFISSCFHVAGHPRARDLLLYVSYYPTDFRDAMLKRLEHSKKTNGYAAAENRDFGKQSTYEHPLTNWKQIRTHEEFLDLFKSVMESKR